MMMRITIPWFFSQLFIISLIFILSVFSTPHLLNEDEDPKLCTIVAATKETNPGPEHTVANKDTENKVAVLGGHGHAGNNHGHRNHGHGNNHHNHASVQATKTSTANVVSNLNGGEVSPAVGGSGHHHHQGGHGTGHHGEGHGSHGHGHSNNAVMSTSNGPVSPEDGDDNETEEFGGVELRKTDSLLDKNSSTTVTTRTGKTIDLFHILGLGNQIRHRSINSRPWPRYKNHHHSSHCPVKWLWAEGYWAHGVWHEGQWISQRRHCHQHQYQYQDQYQGINIDRQSQLNKQKKQEEEAKSKPKKKKGKKKFRGGYHRRGHFG